MVERNLTIENAQILFRNFSGEEGMYNRAGDRNFCVLIDDDTAASLIQDGWSVKYLKPREDGEKPQPYMQVKVKFGNIPPRIVLVTSRNKKELTESDVNILDWAELERVDLIIRPYNWEVNGKSGVKAYLKTGYFTIVEDKFANRYADIPEE
jgi:hypothetical protein